MIPVIGSCDLGHGQSELDRCRQRVSGPAAVGAATVDRAAVGDAAERVELADEG